MQNENVMCVIYFILQFELQMYTFKQIKPFVPTYMCTWVAFSLMIYFCKASIDWREDINAEQSNPVSGAYIIHEAIN